MKLKSNSKDVENDIEDDCQDQARCLKTSASDDLVIVVWPPPLTLISLQLQSGPDHQLSIVSAFTFGQNPLLWSWSSTNLLILCLRENTTHDLAISYGIGNTN